MDTYVAASEPCCGQCGHLERFHDEPTAISRACRFPGPVGCNCTGWVPTEDDENLVAYGLNTNRGGNADVCLEADATPPITNSHGNPGDVMLGASVRRLMPVECERLQAMPDGWTDLGGTADSKRYAALGDAVTASVSEWIGRRLVAA